MRYIRVIALLIVCILVVTAAYVVFGYQATVRDARQTVTSFYRDQELGRETVNIAGPMARSQLSQIESKYGSLESFKIVKVSNKIDGTWEVDVSTVRERGKLAELVGNFGTKGKVRYLYTMP